MNCSAIDTRRASLLQIQVGVYEHEQARVDAGAPQWPDEIRRLIGKELAGWRERNPQRAVLCARAAVMPGQCTFELYHVHQSELAPPVTRRARSAPPANAMPPAAPKCPTCSE